MPRAPRHFPGDICYHALNRSNGGRTIFNETRDYSDFLTLIARACGRVEMRVLAYCLMPNHFHFVLWPLEDGDLGRWMHWLMTSHVRRHHAMHGTQGHVWQGPYKAFPIQEDKHFLTVMRYVERNPLRAGLVERAEEWPWSSLASRDVPGPPGLNVAGPVDLPAEWLDYVNQPQTPSEVESVRASVHRGAPYGGQTWVEETAVRLGLESTLRRRGRPAREQPN